MTGINAGLLIGPTSANFERARVGWQTQNEKIDQKPELSRSAALELAADNLKWFSLLQEVVCSKSYS